MGTSLTVDRSDLADTAQPNVLAELLIQQLVPQLDKLLPLPVVEVAKACGILDFKAIETDAFEGGLIQDEHKTRGFILLKAGVYDLRSRWTIGHELGHFVNLRHVAPPGEERLLCTKDQLRAVASSSGGWRHGIEAQANEFAASLLMPRSQITRLPLMAGSPEIARILALHELCQVSKEAAARRYAQLHGGDFAILFTKDGVLARWPIRGGDFPWLNLKPGQPVFRKTTTKVFEGVEGAVSDQDDSDAAWWLQERDAQQWQLWEEVLIQSKGYRMTLLIGERTEEDD